MWAISECAVQLSVCTALCTCHCHSSVGLFHLSTRKLCAPYTPAPHPPPPGRHPASLCTFCFWIELGLFLMWAESCLCPVVICFLPNIISSRVIHVVAGVRISFLRLDSLFYVDTMFCFSVHPSADTWVASTFWLLCLLCTFKIFISFWL